MPRDVRLFYPADAIVQTSDNAQIHVFQSILVAASPVLRRLIEDERKASLEPTTFLRFELECDANAFIYVLSCSDDSISCPVRLPLTDACLWEFWKVADDLQVASAVLALKRELYRKAAPEPFNYYILSWRHLARDAVKGSLPFLFGATPYGAQNIRELTKCFDDRDDDLESKGSEIALAMDWWMAAVEVAWSIVHVYSGDVLSYPWMSIQIATTRLATGCKCANKICTSASVRVSGRDGATFLISEWFVNCLRRIQHKLREFPSPTTVTDSKKMIVEKAKAHCSEPECLKKVEAEVKRYLEDLAEHVRERLETEVDVGIDKIFKTVEIYDRLPYGILYKPTPRAPGQSSSG